MYEDPNVSERYVTVVFSFASDDTHDDEMRTALVAEINALVDRLGYDAEIHHENMLADA